MILIKQPHKRLVKIATYCIFAIGFIGGIVGFGLSSYYIKTLPRMPKPELRRIYWCNIHGAVVYMTKGEYLFYYGCLAAFVSGIIIICILNLIFRGVWDNDPLSPK